MRRNEVDGMESVDLQSGIALRSGNLPAASSHGPDKPLVKALVVAVHANFSGVASRDENEIQGRKRETYTHAHSRRLVQLTARSACAQNRSRKTLFSIFPEPLFGSSASENSMRRGTL